MYDLIIRNAQVFDGLGHPAVRADVAIRQGVVAEIGAVKGRATQEIDAKGLSLMPGIVDLHTHFDAQVTWDRTMSPSPALGVTTVVMGNCGFGIAPCPAPQRETMMKNLSVVEGMDLTSLLTGVNWGFETFKEYMDQLRSIKPYLNTAFRLCARRCWAWRVLKRPSPRRKNSKRCVSSCARRWRRVLLGLPLRFRLTTAAMRVGQCLRRLPLSKS